MQLPEVYFDAVEGGGAIRSHPAEWAHMVRKPKRQLAGRFNMLNVCSDGWRKFFVSAGATRRRFMWGSTFPVSCGISTTGRTPSASFKNGMLESTCRSRPALEVQLQSATSAVGQTAVQSDDGIRCCFQILERAEPFAMAGETVAPGAQPLQLTDIPAGNYVVSVITHCRNGNAATLQRKRRSSTASATPSK